MSCPKCGYMMTPFDVDCPRCIRIGDGNATIPQSQNNVQNSQNSKSSGQRSIGLVGGGLVVFACVAVGIGIGLTAFRQTQPRDVSNPVASTPEKSNIGAPYKFYSGSFFIALPIEMMMGSSDAYGGEEVALRDLVMAMANAQYANTDIFDVSWEDVNPEKVSTQRRLFFQKSKQTLESYVNGEKSCIFFSVTPEKLLRVGMQNRTSEHPLISASDLIKEGCTFTLFKTHIAPVTTQHKPASRPRVVPPVKPDNSTQMKDIQPITPPERPVGPDMTPPPGVFDKIEPTTEPKDQSQ